MNWHQACELPYYHGSDLGANPTAEETTFKLWAPTACGVVVCLYATGTDAEPGAKELGVHEMRRGDGGVWAIVLPGNLHRTYYIYRIYFPDGRVHEVVDPYARSAGANGTRGMVVDLTQAAPDGWEQDRRPDIPAHARSVWEVHVADFSADGHSGVKPECRAMVAALHRAGLGVVMDVVYNHTYHGESNLERTVPGYWNRRWPNGMMTNGSGCGCDLASERPMVRKYVVESVLYWATAYHIDGFRFDLMALEDVDTMNAIRAALDSLPGGESILLYGEPWMGGGTNLEGGARPADKRALDALHERIGFFCDDTRDCIKGNVFDAANAGYVNGAPQHGYDVLHSISAWRSGAHGFLPKRAGQVVQYVSAHDNYTLWDKLAAVGRRGDYDCPDADLLAQNRMTAGIYLTCQGLPFMQAGEEWGRTKHGDHNSYKGPLATNRLDWTRAHRPEFAALTAFYRGMLAIRRAYPRLSGAAGEPEPFILALPGWLIGFVPENDGTATAGQLAVYYNPERTRQWASLPAGTWRKLSDGVHAGVTPFGPCFRDALELAPTSVTVLVAE